MNKKVRKKPTPRPVRSFLPRGKRARREAEYLSSAVFALLLVIIVVSFAASGLHRVAMRSGNVAAVVSATLVELANQDRAASGLADLKINSVLIAVAQAKANDMAEKGYFAHVSPQGVDPWHWFTVVGYKFEYAGENLAVDFSDSGDVNTAWMNSPTHRKNILDPHYTEIGIATAQGMYQGRLTTFVVQEFGSPAVAKAQAPVTEQTVPAAPTAVAEATTKPKAERAQVLGSEAGAAKAVSASLPPARTPAPKVVASEVAAALTESVARDMPWWAPIVSFPRDTLRTLYYVIGMLVLLALAIDTGFELRWHHRKHAMRAGVLLATMSALFVIAHLWFFAPPVLAAGLSML